MTPTEREIVTLARKAGFHTPTGKRLSMIAEQIRNGVNPSRTISELEQIKRDGGRYIHANHGAER
jgi:hypothetical protein